MNKGRELHRATDVLLDSSPAATLDLHGLTERQCRQILEQRMRLWKRTHSGKIIHIITGKGRGSIGAPVLKKAVAALLRGSLKGGVQDFSEDVDGGGYKVRVR
jgi:DNA-nicking Smr family endonuclease